MRINASLGTGPGLTRQRERSPAGETAVGPVRAALPAVIAPRPARAAETPRLRAQALPTLVAQLVAGAEDMPSARARRRTDPATGAGAYQSVAKLGDHTRPHTGRVI